MSARNRDIPRQRVYINQIHFRDPFKPSDDYNDEGCELCYVRFRCEDDKQEHLAEESHQIRSTYRKNRKDFSESIGGLTFRMDGYKEDNVGRLCITLRENQTQRYELLLVNDTDQPFFLHKFFKICRVLEIDVPRADKDFHPQIQISPSSTFPIEIVVSDTSGFGAYFIPLLFKVTEGNVDGSLKKVLKEVIFRVQTELMDELAPERPYVPSKKLLKEMEEPIVPYKRKNKSGVRVADPVKEYKIPDRLKYLIMRAQTCGELPANEKEEWEEIKTLLEENLTIENYSVRFSLLLHLEELQLAYEILTYAKSDETLDILHNGLYQLEVGGLAEKRPSILKGDWIYVRIKDHNQYRYQGLVTQVNENSIVLDFNDRFKHLYRSGMKVDIRFEVNRFPLKFCHRAVELLSNTNAKKLLFPSADDAPSYPVRTRPLKPWRNRNIENNVEQQQAIKEIVNKSAMPAPYLVFGPPGTGKTITLVEAISQVWMLNESHPEKQLICAPTNSTSDILAERLLIALPKAKIFRYFAMSVNVGTISKEILPNCNVQNGKVFYPEKEILEKCHIIICTLVTSGRLVNVGIKPGHFSYIYVDESGQAIEPEAVISVAGLLTRKGGIVTGQLVLAGDPKQLGPVLHSTLAKKYGFGLSLLERLMTNNELYKKDPITKKYKSNYLTKLVQNFRSHEDILKKPNEMFYDNELQVKADRKIVTRGIGWTELRNKNFPLIFHGIEGIDERENLSPSFFNRQEIDQVLKYMEKLLVDGLGGKRVNPTDIGIISPYSKQVQKFKVAFRLKERQSKGRVNWTKVKVGSVEQFQGDERLVIIISTVRSSQKLIGSDYKFTLGFLKNEKRFNVAITRAKALLIVVGNPHILCHDKYWREFMNFIRDNCGDSGCPWKDPQ